VGPRAGLDAVGKRNSYFAITRNRTFVFRQFGVMDLLGTKHWLLGALLPICQSTRAVKATKSEGYPKVLSPAVDSTCFLTRHIV
jgi:hypothetical protein